MMKQLLKVSGSGFIPLHPLDVRHYSVNACLAPLVSMHGMAVTTVEGIGSTKTRLHAVQVSLFFT